MRGAAAARPWTLLAVALALAACERTTTVAATDATSGGAAQDTQGADVAHADVTDGQAHIDWQQMTPPPSPLPVQIASDGTTVFGVAVNGFVASTDLGASWEVRGALGVNSLAAGGDEGEVYALTSTGLQRSADSGLTFAPLSLPSALALADLHTIQPGAQGRLWLAVRPWQPGVAVSNDHGQTFQTVPLPAETTMLTPCVGPHPDFFAIRNQGEAVHSDGGAFTSWGHVQQGTFCAATATGTMLVSGYHGQYELARRTLDGTAWELQITDDYWRFVPGKAAVWRIGTSGRVDVSLDDGASWQPRVTSAPTGFAVNSAAVVGDALVAITGTGAAVLKPDATAWEALDPPGLPVFLRVLDMATSSEGPAMALLLDESPRRTVYVTEDGATWYRGLTFDGTDGVRAIAIRADGQEIALGGLFGKYWLLHDHGRTIARADTIATEAGQVETLPVRQMQWVGTPGTGTTLVATTADEQDTGGNVWIVNPESPYMYWDVWTPKWTVESLSVTPGGYHALAISRKGLHEDPALTVGHRAWTGTNAWTTMIYSRVPMFGLATEWTELQPMLAFFPPISAAFSHGFTSTAAMLWTGNQMYIGPGWQAMLPSPISTGLGEARVVRFDHIGRLWLGTSAGLWRSQPGLVVP